MATKRAVTTKTKKELYKSHTVPTTISATSRLAIKIRDNYYTIEAHGERTVVEQEGLDLDAEWQMLFNDINRVVDNQAEDIVESTKNKS